MRRAIPVRRAVPDRVRSGRAGLGGTGRDWTALDAAVCMKLAPGVTCCSALCWLKLSHTGPMKRSEVNRTGLNLGDCLGPCSVVVHWTRPPAVCLRGAFSDRSTASSPYHHRRRRRRPRVGCGRLAAPPLIGPLRSARAAAAAAGCPWALWPHTLTVRAGGCRLLVGHCAVCAACGRHQRRGQAACGGHQRRGRRRQLVSADGGWITHRQMSTEAHRAALTRD